MSKKVLELFQKQNSVGVIGTEVPNFNKVFLSWGKNASQLHVGDIVRYRTRRGNEHEGIICKNYKERERDMYSIMGWFGEDLRTTADYEVVSIVVPYKFLTNSILYQFHDEMRIQERTIRLLTLDEIRSYVPFEFELK